MLKHVLDMNRSILLNKHFQSFLLIIFIILFDRFIKYWVISYFNAESSGIIYLAPFLNIDLIWNKGIAFGLLSFNESYFYNIISLVIAVIIIVLVIMSLKSQGFKRYSILMIVGGALGNLHDRIFFKAVPDFIDFHVGNFHWFVFNAADIFITIGVIFLILFELIDNNKENYE